MGWGGLIKDNRYYNSISLRMLAQIHEKQIILTPGSLQFTKS